MELKLREMGADKDVRKEISQSLGQKCVYSTDYWKTAQKCLDDYKNGTFDKSGVELSKKLVAEESARLRKNYVQRN